MNLSDRLKQVIDIKNLTSYKISSDTGISESVLSRILKGKTRKPQSSTVTVLAKYLQVSEQWLLSGEGEMTDIAEGNASADCVGMHQRTVHVGREVFNLITSQQELMSSQQKTIQSQQEFMLSQQKTLQEIIHDLSKKK